MSNYKYPEVTNEMRTYWLEGQTGGQLLIGFDGHLNGWFWKTYEKEIRLCLIMPAEIEYSHSLN